MNYLLLKSLSNQKNQSKENVGFFFTSDNKTSLLWWHDLLTGFRVMVSVMAFNATFNNISCISWRSVLLVEDSKVLRENHRPDASH